jgi:thiol-disulfide isomerase/thioredoxin
VLPKDAAELAKGWSYSNEPRQVTTSFIVAESKPAVIIFTGTESGPLSRIYVTTQKSTYHFDTAKGMVTAIETEQTQDYGFHTKGTGKITLQSDETLPADTVAQLAADAEALFAAKKQYQATMAAMEKSNEPVADQLLAAGRLLDSAAAAAKTEDVKKEFAKLRERLNDSAEDAGREAKDRNAILNKPAAPWEATDIDGHPVKLADFKGKVVVMDFWYRGCGWCMYATPQVKQLAADYKDKPVTVLGMNTDRDEKDARLVIDVMGITYPTIKSTGIPEKYGIHGFPTLVVVDPAGVVRHIHVGYSPTLRQDVGKVIDQLLAGDKNAATP